MRRRFRSAPIETRPWTDDEDRRLRDMLNCGLANEFWHCEFPDRRFGEIAERRLALGIASAPLI